MEPHFKLVGVTVGPLGRYDPVEEWHLNNPAPSLGPGPVRAHDGHAIGAIREALATLDSHVDAMQRVRGSMAPIPRAQPRKPRTAKQRSSSARPDGLLSVADVAEHFGVGTHAVLGWIASGELKAVNVGVKGAKRATWRVTREALEEFELARGPKGSKRSPTRRKKDKPGDVIRFY